MRVLVVENYQGTDLGNVGAALNEANAELDVRRAYLGDELPKDASEHDALVMFGGGQNALADDSHPYFPELLDLIRDFAHKDRSVLGICLGSQLVARAFGGINQVGGASEFGWHGVTLTDEAKADAVLGAMPEPLQRASIIEPYLPFIEQTLEKFPSLTASRLYAMVRERGYRGLPTHFRHLVALHRPRKPAEAFLRLRTLPGEQGQVDRAHFGHIEIGNARRPLMAFVMVLSCSRDIYQHFFLDARMETRAGSA